MGDPTAASAVKGKVADAALEMRVSHVESAMRRFRLSTATSSKFDGVDVSVVRDGLIGDVSVVAS